MSQARGQQSRSGFYVAVLAVVVLGVGAILWATNRAKQSAVITVPTAPIAGAKAEGYVMGNPNAPVEIVEFADFECPACGQFATVTEPDIRKNLIATGRAKYRLYDFQVNSVHVNSPAASLAAACANDQGKFWEMHDQLFRGQNDWNTQATSDPKPIFRGYASGLGLNVPAWEQCYDGRKYVDRIAAHGAEAQRMKIGGTPTFFVGNKQLVSAPTYDAIMALVDSAAKAPAAAPAGDTAAKTGVTP